MVDLVDALAALLETCGAQGNISGDVAGAQHVQCTSSALQGLWNSEAHTLQVRIRGCAARPAHPLSVPRC